MKHLPAPEPLELEWTEGEARPTLWVRVHRWPADQPRPVETRAMRARHSASISTAKVEFFGETRFFCLHTGRGLGALTAEWTLDVRDRVALLWAGAMSSLRV